MNNNETPVTIDQLMEICVNQLSSIVVPVSLTEQIAIPIYRVINNLKVGLSAISSSAEKTSQPQTQEPEVEILSVEENQNGSGSEENEN